MIVLPWHNPVLLAEQAATIDLLSGGRLDFGVGKGYRHDEFASFCIPQEEADERFEEGLALILKSWTSEQRFSHHGKYWHFEDIIVEPPTAQKPHPPIWMGGGQPGLDPQGGAARLQAAARPASPRWRTTIERFNIYKAEVEKPAAGGSTRWMSASAAPSSSRATPRKRPRRSRRGSPTSSGWSRPAARRTRRARRACCRSTRRSDAAGESAMFGTPDEIAAKLEALRAAGIEHMLLNGPTGSRDNLRGLRARCHAGVRRRSAAGRAAPRLVKR